MDIYIMPEWGLVSRHIEKGETRVFECRDIVSPYGYGGSYIEICEARMEESLLKEYEARMSEFCRTNNIVSEFVRFHPIIGSGKDFKGIYNAERVRQTVGTNLAYCDNPVLMSFQKAPGNMLREQLRGGHMRCDGKTQRYK